MVKELLKETENARSLVRLLWYRKCPKFRKSQRSALSTSMTEENCSYFKNMRNMHLLDEHNNLPGCELF